MNSSQFMVFSIDEPIQCIESFHGSESEMFIVTQKRIILYDLCESNMIAQCKHQTGITRQKQQNGNKTQSTNNEQNSQTAIEIHYFPINLNQEHKQNSNEQKAQQYLIGHLLVHYKMKGITIYALRNKITKQYQPDYINKKNCLKYQIVFDNFTPIMYGSAFLTLAFDNIHYQRVKTAQQVSLSQLLLSKKSRQQMSNKQIDNTLKDMKSFQDYEMRDRNVQGQFWRQFWVFINENELYEVKKMRIQNGKLQILQRYQLDEQTAELSLSAVTEMKVIEYVNNVENTINRLQRQLILTMQGGNIYIYQLPIKNNNQNNNKDIQHYLQPISKIYMQQYIKSQINQITQKQDLDYSIQCIQMIYDGMGLVVVRKYGIYLVDFKNNKIINQISTQLNNINNQNQNQKNQNIKSKNINKTNQLLEDTKFIIMTQSKTQSKVQSKVKLNNQSKVESNNQYDIQQKDSHFEKQTTNMNHQQTFTIKKHTTISSSLILFTSNKLLKLNLDLNLTKSFNKNKTYSQSIQITNLKLNTIEQINTQIILSLKINRNQSNQPQNQINSYQSELIDSSHSKKTHIYGHYKQGKVFYLTY